MLESINLNLIPSGVNPVCHVSQYDAGRQIRINLFEGINPYTIQSGDAFTLNVRKPDNTIVTTSVSGTQGNNYITISTTQQIAAVVGENLCDIKITNGATVIGTLNFIMQVERDVLADGVASQSIIEDLDERIAEAIGDNYYNKTQTDALLNDKADKSNTYTKTETDSLLALKADKSNTYTKSETDALLALKPDKSEVYNVYPTEQESGAIASFTDGADNIPVKSLVSQIEAKQSGLGTPSPSNIREISGFNNGIITRCGKNLYNKATITIGKYITNTGAEHSTTTGTYSDYIPIKKNTPYYFSHIIGLGAFYSVAVYDENKTFIECVNIQGSYDSSDTITFTKGAYIRVNVSNACVDICQIEFGTSATAYTPFVASNSYTFTFGQTIYGGHFDNKGNLVVDCGFIDLGTISWNTGTANRSKTTVLASLIKVPLSTSVLCGAIGEKCYEVPASSSLNTDGQFAVLNTGELVFYRNVDTPTGLFVYPLATPITLSIASQDIPSILGENNIFSNTGDVDVTIRADIGLYIDKRL